MKKRFFASILTIVILMTLTSATALAIEDGTANEQDFVVAKTPNSDEDGITPLADDDTTQPMSGTCGATDSDNVSWALMVNNNDETNPTYTLTISGSGAMEDYNDAQGQPWYNYGSSISQVTIASGISHLGGCVFQGFSNITSIVIPNSVTSLGKQVFKNCAKLAEITIPDTITNLGDSVFQGTAVSAVTLPEGLITAGKQLFYACTSLKEVTLPNSLTSLGQSTFYGTTSLEKVTFGDGLSEIPSQTFLNSSALKTIVFPANLTSIGQRAFKGSEIEEIAIPYGVEEIGAEAFRGCVQLKSITIPDSVTTIGNNAIRECTALESIVIPDGVTSIGETALCGSTSLKCIVLGEGLENLSTTFVFSGIDYPLIYAKNDVAFNANSESKIIVARTDGGGFETAPQSKTSLATPSKIGYQFMGWYEDSSYTNPVSGALKQIQGQTFQTYYAKWEKCNHEDEQGNSTLSDATCTVAPICSICGATEGEALGHSFTDYVYNNDATYTSDGTKTAKCDRCEETDTITAEGTQLIRSSSSSGSSSSTYAVATPSSVKNGTVTVSPKNASKGTMVTITAKPADGYEVDEVIVTDKNGDTVKVTAKGNDKYTFVMPAGKVDVEVTFVQEYAAPAISFDDVSKSAWYYDAAIYAAENGLMSGTGNNNFSPDVTTSRAMIWTILAKLDGQNIAVTYGNWYDKAQQWAMVNGVSDGTTPNGSVTREQLAVMLYSYAKDQGYRLTGGVSLSRYVDAGSVSPWAVEALEWAVGNGLISSMGNNILAPTGTATRAQVVVILMNFCENVVK